MTRNCHALSPSPNTHGMGSERHKTYLSSRLFPRLFPKRKVKVLIAKVLRSHYSQFLRFSESPMMSPNFLNHCVIISSGTRMLTIKNTSGETVFRCIPGSRLGFLEL